MTIAPPRNKVLFALTTANELELLAGFRLASVNVGWSKQNAMRKVLDAMFVDFERLHASLLEWCLTPIAYRAN